MVIGAAVDKFQCHSSVLNHWLRSWNRMLMGPTRYHSPKGSVYKRERSPDGKRTDKVVQI